MSAVSPPDLYCDAAVQPPNAVAPQPGTGPVAVVPYHATVSGQPAICHTHHPTRVHAQRLPICDTSGGDHLVYPRHNLNDDITAPSWYKCCG